VSEGVSKPKIKCKPCIPPVGTVGYRLDSVPPKKPHHPFPGNHVHVFEMQYIDTKKVIHVGDSVLYAGAPGVIVFVIDDDSYSERYTKENWSYLGKGLGIEIQDKARTLYHLIGPDEDLEPVSLAKNRT
jgi:hypothetical protein